MRLLQAKLLYAIVITCAALVWAESSYYYDIVTFITEGKNAYAILGVTQSTPLREIKKAFRKVSIKHHPDKVGRETQAYLDIVQAFNILSNADAKAEYDDMMLNGIPFLDQYYNRYMHEWGAPKHDIRYVLLWTFTTLNVLKYAYDYWKHWNIVGKIKRHSNAYKVKKNEILRNKYGSQYKKHKHEEVDIPMEITGAEAPQFKDILLIQILMIPYFTYKYILWACFMDDEARIEAHCKKQGITRAEYDKMLADYQLRQKKFRNSAKMKRYLKWRKKMGKD